MSPRLRIGPRTGVLLFALVLVGLELGLYHLGRWGWHTVTVADARLGWRKVPEQTGVWNNDVVEEINSWGYRDREWAPPAEAGASVLAGGRDGLRVAILGDSVAYGHWVSIEETFGRRLEERLREREAQRPEPRDALVMNFAMEGYVFEQMGRVWEDEVRPFRPDVLIVTVNAFSARPMRNFEAPPEFPLRRFLLRTALYDFVNRGLLRERGFLRVQEGRDWDEEERRAAAEAGRADRRMRVSPFAPEHEGRWRTMAARLEGMAGQCAEDGTRLVLVSMPRLEDLLGEMGQWTGDRWEAWCAGRPEVRHVDPRLRFWGEMSPLFAALERRRIEPRAVWSRGPARRSVEDVATAVTSLYFFEDPDHLSPRGHVLLAEQLLRALEPAGSQ